MAESQKATRATKQRKIEATKPHKPKRVKFLHTDIVFFQFLEVSKMNEYLALLGVFDPAEFEYDH